MTPAEHLQAAKALLTDPTKWTKGNYARDAEGYAVAVDDSMAVAWCAQGALYRFRDDSMANLYLHCAVEGDSPSPDYNDSLTEHADLLAWFDRAIALAEQDQ
jgi:hypothetical protein